MPAGARHSGSSGPSASAGVTIPARLASPLRHYRVASLRRGVLPANRSRTTEVLRPSGASSCCPTRLGDGALLEGHPTQPAGIILEDTVRIRDEGSVERYSVSRSFWTRSGLKKARQGHLVGSLPWGCIRDPATKLDVPDPTRAPLVLEMFERYAAGGVRPHARRLAKRQGAPSAHAAGSSARTPIRDMFCNAAYAECSTSLRDRKADTVLESIAGLAAESLIVGAVAGWGSGVADQ
jgi:hypothetical protein